ncbi:MAG: hypothetical protein L0387_46410, partial [Acidobacteria bacterium]|nr:hypothetical protein [Acidobacteriota bacterium]
YGTSRTVTYIDKEEEDLSTELGLFIKIRDRKWVVANINRSAETIAAFNSYLAPATAFLAEVGGATLIDKTQNVSARTMCVFLGQEIERRRGNTDLLEAVTDSLILWALEGTDPDKGIFLSRQEILDRIEKALPSAKQFVRGVYKHRLEMMASKHNPTGREIRWYKKEDKFCLPYETRLIVEAENTEDEFLKLQVLELFEQRATRCLERESKPLDPSLVAQLSHRAIEFTFEKEGLELAAFLTGENEPELYSSIADQVDEAIIEMGVTGEDALVAKEAALAVLRQAFYTSSEEERTYFGKLSRTFTLMFTLRNEPKVVEYFKSMSSDFVLYVGADIIIRALSERYLANEDRMTDNMLRILKDAGSTLILTDACLEEVHTHLEATDWEFRNEFMGVEPYVTKEIVRHSSKILIRSYFYAKFDPLLGKRPAGWRSFIGQICDYEQLHKTAGRIQIRGYLQERFGLEFATHDDMKKLVDPKEVSDLAERLKPIKKEEVLAVNDALQILAIYGKRRSIGEEHRPNPYGYRTWWLTHETRVRQFTAELVRAHGSRYIMRPEFILNFIALSPSMEEVRLSYGTIFPTLLGVRLSNRMREEVFRDVMRRMREAAQVDDARARVMAAALSNQLKGDHFKRYETDL